MSTPSSWAFLGNPKPKWSLGLGWGSIYAFIPAWFIFGNVLQNAPYAGWFCLLAGGIATVVAFKHRSFLLLSFGILEALSYGIIVIIAGVNTP